MLIPNSLRWSDNRQKTALPNSFNVILTRQSPQWVPQEDPSLFCKSEQSTIDESPSECDTSPILKSRALSTQMLKLHHRLEKGPGQSVWSSSFVFLKSISLWKPKLVPTCTISPVNTREIPTVEEPLFEVLFPRIQMKRRWVNIV